MELVRLKEKLEVISLVLKKWDEIGDIKRFVPIGWLGYSGGNVLYEVSTSNIYLEFNKSWFEFWGIEGD
jgi:hypothetical protein